MPMQIDSSEVRISFNGVGESLKRDRRSETNLSPARIEIYILAVCRGVDAALASASLRHTQICLGPSLPCRSCLLIAPACNHPQPT